MKTVILSQRERGACSVQWAVRTSRTSGDRRMEHRGVTPGGSSPIHSWPGGGGCEHGGSSAALVKLGGCELVSQGSPVFVSGGLMPWK